MSNKRPPSSPSSRSRPHLLTPIITQSSRRDALSSPKSRLRGGGSFSSLSSLASTLTSCTDTEDIHDWVYVRDVIYAWLPAEVQSTTSDGLSVEVKVVLPDDWERTTILYDESSIKELEYQMDPSRVRNGHTISSPQFGSGANCRMKMEHAPDRTTYNTYRKKRNVKKVNDGIVRTIELREYPNGALPIQNVDLRQNRRMSRNNDNRKNNASHLLVNARDMADLPFLHEAAVLYNLKLRNKRKMPYTRVGDIMVAMNPFQWIEELYSSENQALYARYLIWGINDARNGLIKNSMKENLDELGSGILPTPMEDELSYTDSSIASPIHAELSNKDQPTAHGSYYSKLGLEPHVYETASLAYNGLASSQQNQTILVSGESGAGKTDC